MISLENYQRIENEIKDSLFLAFEQIKDKSLSDYILLLAYGEYKENILQSECLNPNLIEYTLDRHHDFDRMSFLAKMLNNFHPSTYDDENYEIEQITHLQLMTYTHIWESKLFLKTLYRIAQSLNGESYKWSVNVPDMAKHSFIRCEIRDVMELNNCALSNIIKKGYHSSLRNAFAHSEYYFDFISTTKRIELINYNRQEWEMKNITLSDWNERFVYSALLSYHLYTVLNDKKKNIVEELGTNIFTIEWPSRDGVEVLKRKIEFSKSCGEFIFYK